jgi:hypothetical protein
MPDPIFPMTEGTPMSSGNAASDSLQSRASKTFGRIARPTDVDQGGPFDDVSQQADGDAEISSEMPAEVEARLRQAETLAAGANSVAQMLAIPEVRDVLGALQQGRRVKVIPEDEYNATVQNQQQSRGQGQGSQTEEEEEPKWEELAPKDLARTLQKRIVGSLLKEVGTVLSSQLQPIAHAVKDLQGESLKIKESAVQQDITQTVKKYPDLFQYKDAMIKLHAENPGLDVEELYHLARKRVGKVPIARNTDMDSERPTQTSTRPGGQARRGAPATNAPRGNDRGSFDALLSSALKRAQFQASEE